jgi:hypothetical protein
MSFPASLVNTTIRQYAKEQEVNVWRDYKAFAMLKSKGRVTFNHSGLSFTRRVRFRRNGLRGMLLGDTLTFPNVDRWKTMDLPWRGYAMGESFTKMERQQNKGKEAIIDVFGTKAEVMMEDAKESLAEEIYVDGEAAGNSARFHGVESFGSNSGVTRPFIANPNDTYAGLTCTLGSNGGSWTGDWPLGGKGPPEFDFWSPVIVDVTNASFAAATKTWINTCLEAISYGIMATQMSKAMTGMLQTIFLNNMWYKQAKDRLHEKQGIWAESNSSNSDLVKLGFKDVFVYDGVDVTTEYGIPSETGYGFNWAKARLMSLQGQLFEADGPDWDPAARAWRFALDCMGNFEWNPRSFLFFRRIS